ncbi:MAG TPA: hypothetical protein VFS97_02630 [Nitrososphaeraceae archaeon]|nr:hypothetical protein [Nitrososphaeraceae archaeon]
MPSPSDIPSHYLKFSYFYCLRSVGIIVVISLVVFHLQNSNIFNNMSKGIAYAHIFTDTENAVTKNVDGKYQVSFLPYPVGLLVNDTSTKLNFSIMENNTDVSLLLTSLVITDKNTGRIVGQTPYKFHEFGDVTYPYIFRGDGEYKVAIQAKINGDPKYKSQPLMASFDVAVRDIQKMTNSFQQIMYFYIMPALAGIVGIIIYSENRRGRKRKE